jgi:hypothetical protein
LNKEILDNSNKIFLVLNISIPSTAVLIGLALNAQLPSKWLPFLLLLPFSVIIPSMYIVISSLNSTVRIATYIKVFYEDDLRTFLWQSRLQKLREREKTNPGVYRAFRASLESIFITLGFIVIALSFGYYFLVSTLPLKSVYFIALMIITVLLVFLFYMPFRKLRKRWDADYFQEFIA